MILPALKKSPKSLSWYEFDPQRGYLIATVDTGLHQSATERAALEKDDAAKTGAASRFGNTCRGIIRCMVKNVDGLVFLLIDAGTGGLCVGNAMDAAQGIAECLSKTGAGAHPSSKADEAARRHFGKRDGKGHQTHSQAKQRQNTPIGVGTGERNLQGIDLYGWL